MLKVVVWLGTPNFNWYLEIKNSSFFFINLEIPLIPKLPLMPASITNIWMGVSVENQTFTYRVSDLLKTNAQVKFLSIEPLIGKISTIRLRGIDWVIVGGESGPKARPIKKEWIDILQRKCNKVDIPFFFKQWGKREFNINPQDPTIKSDHKEHAKGGCQVDGIVYRAMSQYC